MMKETSELRMTDERARTGGGAMAFCTNCGKQLVEGAGFCAFCGT
ncbi:MAG: zinc-ribbon domain-containing protein, partial [Lachnospiraceae bacterium]|nr:zinc-ribbon domain-containing protein [Lachnospiraceae bacterium]